LGDKLLKVDGLRTHFYTYKGVVKALDGINLEIDRGICFGVAGETGCGKSVTALSIMRLVPPPGEIVSGEVKFKGEDLLLKSEEEMRKIRGAQISMIFQDPSSSLNPVFSIGNQLIETIQLHRGISKNEAEERAIEMLNAVRVPPENLKAYPHELSGGMKQRIMIAMALLCQPDLLIADEPTTNLDVTTQAQVLDLIRALQRNFGTTVFLITHNLGIIAEMCDKVAIMYAGRIIEHADVKSIFKNPKHPYSKGLLEAIPTIRERKDYLKSIQGNVPNLINPPSGCRFHPRCDYAMDICKKEKPQEIEIEPGHFVECHLYNK